METQNNHWMNQILEQSNIGYAILSIQYNNYNRIQDFKIQAINDLAIQALSIDENSKQLKQNELFFLKLKKSLQNNKKDILKITIKNDETTFDVSVVANDKEQIFCTFTDVSQYISEQKEYERLTNNYNALLNNVNMPVCWVRKIDDQYICEYVNDKYTRLFGLLGEMIIGKKTTNYRVRNNSQSLTMTSIYEQCMQTKTSEIVKVYLHGKYGKMMILPFVEAGKCIGVIELFLDITNIKETEQELERVLSQIGYSVWRYHCETQELSINMPSMYGCVKYLNIDQYVKQYVLEEDQAYFNKEFRSFVVGNQPSISYKYRVKDTILQWRWIEISGNVVTRAADGAPQYIVGIANDITYQQHMEKQMQTMIHYDPLTGLANRRKLSDEMSQLLKNDKKAIKAAGIYFDIDDFKTVNDLYGHDIGDECLKDVAKVITRLVPEKAKVASLTSDEFYVFIPEYKSKKAVEELTQDIIKVISEIKINRTIFDQSVHIKACAGIVFCPEHVTECSKMLSYADIAMLQAKQTPNKFYEIYKQEYTEKYFEQYKLIHDLRRGLKNCEFQMYYQPIVSANNMQVVEMEALIRWNHPEHGLLLPGQFIHVAETSGEIIEISHQMLISIARQMKSWQENKEHEEVIVAVNIAPIQLEIESFADSVLNILQKYNVEPSRICIEITETMAMTQMQISRMNIKKLRQAGCLIALDDFGIEYSTLSQLENIEFDIIKIDRSFTNTIEESYVSQTIVDMIQKIISRLGKKCIVEGIETKQQMELMLNLGFEQMQGYYFSKPIQLAN